MRRPAVQAVADAPASSRDTGFTVRRALILNGILFAAVIVAVVAGRGSGPGAITFEPDPWRCGGGERSWSATIPATADTLVIEWRSGGPEGAVRATAATARSVLEPFRQPDGSYRVTSAGAGGAECSLPSGRYTVVLRDAGTAAALAVGEVEMEAE